MSDSSPASFFSDSFLPPDARSPVDRLQLPRDPGSHLRGLVLQFEPEDRNRFCRGLGVLRAGAVRELLPSALC